MIIDGPTYCTGIKAKQIVGAAWRRADSGLGSPCPPLRSTQVLCSSAKFFYANMYDKQGSKNGAGEVNMLCFVTALFLLLVKSQDTKNRWCLNTINYSTA